MCGYEKNGECTLNECMYYPIGLCESVRNSIENEIRDEIIKNTEENALAEQIAYDEGRKQGRSEAVQDTIMVIRNGMQELLKSPWGSNKFMRSNSDTIKEAFEILDTLVIRNIIANKENQNDYTQEKGM